MSSSTAPAAPRAATRRGAATSGAPTTALSRRSSGLLVWPVALVYVVPLVWMVATSLKAGHDVSADPADLWFSPTVDAYRVVSGEALWRSMLVSAQISVAVTIGVILLGVPAAYGLARLDSRLRYALIGALLIFQMIPPAASLIPLYRLLTIFGLANSRTGLILIDLALFLPFAILLLRPFCLSIPREVEEAALLDGAGPQRLLGSVIFPLVRNGVFVVAVMVFILTWGEFINAITFISDPQLQPLSALLSSQVTQYGVRWNNLMAIAVITSLPLVVLYLLVHRRLQEGLALGAGK